MTEIQVLHYNCKGIVAAVALCPSSLTVVSVCCLFFCFFFFKCTEVHVLL